jgi:hypothetical protein
MEDKVRAICILHRTWHGAECQCRALHVSESLSHLHCAFVSALKTHSLKLHRNARNVLATCCLAVIRSAPSRRVFACLMWVWVVHWACSQHTISVNVLFVFCFLCVDKKASKKCPVKCPLTLHDCACVCGSSSRSSAQMQPLPTFNTIDCSSIHMYDRSLSHTTPHHTTPHHTTPHHFCIVLHHVIATPRTHTRC